MKLKVIDKIGDIDEKIIEKAMKIDSKKALQIEKEKELNKKHNSIWKYLLVPVMACLLLVVFIGGKKTLENRNVVKSNNRYLSANYALKMYGEANAYIKENIDLSKIKNNHSIKIKDNKFIESKEEEYKYCSGDVVITRVNDIYQYNIDSKCNNRSDYNISLTMKVFTNINNQDRITGIYDIDKSDLGYSIILEESNELISGVLDLNDSYDINSINYFGNSFIDNSNSFIKLSNNYLAILDINSEKHIVLFDNDLKMLWESYDIDYDIHNVLYETNDYIYFSYNNKVYKLSKNDGTATLELELEYDLSESNYNIFYNNGILYGYNSLGGNSVFIYDLKGKVLRNIPIKDNYDSDNKNINVMSGKDITMFANNHKVLVINKKGEVVNTIMLDNSEEDPLYDLNITDDYYEISYNLVNESNKKCYIRYSLDNTLMFKEIIDMEYGLSTLERMGLNVEDMDQNSIIINGKLIETVYSKENNGTLLVMSYDYGDSSNGQDAISDLDNNDNNTNQESINAKSLIYVDSNIYNGYRIGLTTDKELILFKTDEHGMIEVLGKMPYTFTGSNYADGYYAKIDGNQVTIRVDNYINNVYEKYGSTVYNYSNGHFAKMMEFIEDYVITESSKGTNSNVHIGLTIDNKIIVYKEFGDSLQVRYKTDYYKAHNNSTSYFVDWNQNENEPIRLRVDKYTGVQAMRYSYTKFEFDKEGNILSKKEYLDEHSLLREDSKTYGEFHMAFTTGYDLILFKYTDDGSIEIYYTMPYYNYGSTFYNGHYADWNNGEKQQIRVRIDKYISGNSERYSYIWYTFDKDGKLVSINEFLDDNSISYIDQNSYNGFKIAMTINNEFVLYKELNGKKMVVYKFPYSYSGNISDAYHIDYNNAGSEQIRVRIDKYINGQSDRYSSIWYFFDKDGNKLDTDEYLY